MNPLFFSTDSKLIGLTIFLSVALFQLAFMSFQWYLERRKDYLYYLTYLFSIMVYAIAELESALPIKVFTLITSDFHKYFYHLIPYMAVFFYYRFSRAFLNLPERRPRLNQRVIQLEYFILGYALVSPILLLTGVDPDVELWLFVAASVMVLTASVVIILSLLKRSHLLARFAMLGAGSLLLGATLTLTFSLIEDYGYYLGFDPRLPLLLFVIIELLIFSTGLTFKTRLIEQQNLETEKKLIRELKKRQEAEKRVNKIRENIARDLHDEVGSGLSQISLLGELLLREIQNPRLKDIVQKSKEMVKAMGDIVFSLKAKDEKLDIFMFKTRRQLLDFCENTSFMLQIEFPEHFPNIKLSGAQQRNIYLILRESLNNAMKHSGGDKATISAAIANSRLTLKIGDNGKGIGQIQSAYRKNGLKNIRARAIEISGKVDFVNDRGAMIILEVPLVD